MIPHRGPGHPPTHKKSGATCATCLRRWRRRASASRHNAPKFSRYVLAAARRESGLRLAILCAPFFPVTAVEGTHRHRLDAAAVDAACVDADAIGMRARNIKRLHAAGCAEQVFRDAGVERIGCERIAAAQQLEALGGYLVEQKSGFDARRGVAL